MVFNSEKLSNEIFHYIDSEIKLKIRFRIIFNENYTGWIVQYILELKLISLINLTIQPLFLLFSKCLGNSNYIFIDV